MWALLPDCRNECRRGMATCGLLKPTLKQVHHSKVCCRGAYVDWRSDFWSWSLLTWRWVSDGGCQCGLVMIAFGLLMTKSTSASVWALSLTDSTFIFRALCSVVHFHLSCCVIYLAVCVFVISRSVLDWDFDTCADGPSISFFPSKFSE